MNWTIKPFTARPGGVIEISVPADKSITHRAMMLGALSAGEVIVHNYLAADDCLSTMNAMRSLGVSIVENKPDVRFPHQYLVIQGVGLSGLKKPNNPIDAGNSGTTVRLLSGILAAQDFETEIIGDESLSRRPMQRIIEPLRLMGVTISARENNFLPLRIKGNPNLKPITYTSKIASAQVKSCVLFAGMYAQGTTTFIEPVKSRDHTERMLETFGVRLRTTANSASITGPVNLKDDIVVLTPQDISAAAFFLVAGVLLPSVRIKIPEVGVNPTRSGILDVLKTMGADIRSSNRRGKDGEIVEDLEVGNSRLTGCNINEAIMPRLIDEIPIIALAATQAEGTTEISGARELRVKESDRLQAIANELKKMGADIEENEDGLVITGPTPLRGGALESYKDHRIAMTLAIAGLIAHGQTSINDTECVSISFPDFKEKLQSLGADIQ